jgi:sRNA-binding protein
MIATWRLIRMERIEYAVELERTDGPAEHASMTLPPALTKGQRLNVPVGGEVVQAEVIEVTKLTTRRTDQVETARQGSGEAVTAGGLNPNRSAQSSER